MSNEQTKFIRDLKEHINKYYKVEIPIILEGNIFSYFKMNREEAKSKNISGKIGWTYNNIRWTIDEEEFIDYILSTIRNGKIYFYHKILF